MLNTQINRQISQVSSINESRMPSSNIIDELVPALNQLMNIQQRQSPPSLPPSSINKPVESPPALPETIVNHQIQTSMSTSTMQSRSSSKSFSNRLGMMMPSNQTQNSILQEQKPIPSPHQYLPQKSKSKSPIIVKQQTISSNNKKQNELQSNEHVLPCTHKCKFLFFLILISIYFFLQKVKLN